MAKKSAKVEYLLRDVDGNTWMEDTAAEIFAAVDRGDFNLDDDTFLFEVRCLGKVVYGARLDHE
jgi:hypothetical protein